MPLNKLGTTRLAIEASVSDADLDVVGLASPGISFERSGHYRLAPPKPASAPSAAPGPALSGCSMANLGPTLPDFQRGAVRAGPLYFTPEDAAVSQKARAPQLARPTKLYVVVVVISGLSPGRTVAVTAAPAYRRYLRFLFGPGNSLSPGTTYSMANGEAGVTFVACPRETGYTNQQVTDYYGGFLISGDRCVPVDVRLARRPGLIIARLGACRQLYAADGGETRPLDVGTENRRRHQEPSARSRTLADRPWGRWLPRFVRPIRYCFR